MPSTQRLWQSFKTATGYDAANSRSILHHALHAWYFWHECSSAKSHSQFCASASGVARRPLRGWRRWMIRTRLFAPSWQRYRIWPRQLPPLPARKPPARLEPRPVLSHLAYGRKFWRGKSGSQRELALETSWHDPKKLQRLRLREEWEAAHSPPSGALQARSRSAVAQVVAEQHSPGGSMADSVLWGGKQS